MSILKGCRKLVPSLLRSHVTSEQMRVFGFVCYVPQAKCHSVYLRRQYTDKSSYCRHWHRVHVLNCQFNPHRYYSESDESSTTSSTASGEVEDLNSVHRSSKTFTLDLLVSLLRQENAVDLCVIKVPENIKYAEYFVVATGVSPRHLHAMTLYVVKVYKFLKKDGGPHVKIEGKEAEDWMCIDFGKIVVHFMLRETREIYELEKLWTLRAYDEQLQRIPAEKLPEDFVLDLELTK